MRQLRSTRRLLILASTLILSSALLLVATFYFQPMKFKKTKRFAFKWIKIFLPEKKLRDYAVTAYKHVILHSDIYQRTQSLPLDAAKTHTRLMEREFDTDSQSLSKVSVSLDGQRRNAVAGVVPFRFSYELRVPEDGYIRFGLNQEGWQWLGGELDFTVQVSNKAVTERIFEVQLPSSYGNWKDISIDLSAFSGQDVKMEFNVSADNKRPFWRTLDKRSVKAYWSDLFVESRAQSNRKPNVFLIMVDTLRPDHLGCYGYKRNTSPNIDRLCRKGVRFDKAFSSSPWTDPAILGLFTGLYPSDLWEPKTPKGWSHSKTIPGKIDTLTEILSAHGYFTIAASDHPGINSQRFGHGVDMYAHLYYGDSPLADWHDTDAEKVLKTLRMIHEVRPEGGVFTYVHLIYPHQPYQAPPPFDGYFGPSAPEITRQNRQEVINMYDAEIRRADYVVGEFLDHLQRLNLDDESIIIVVSDHGEGFWEHGLWEHGNSLYNELLHIPLIFHAPGRLPEGETVSQVVRNVDILPTILDLTGIPYNIENYRGVSLLPLMRGEKAREKRLAFSEFPHSRLPLGRALQSSTEKLIDTGHEGNPLEYYDTMNDPGELHNLSPAETHRVSDLMNIMNDTSKTALRIRNSHPTQKVEHSDDTIKKLKSLGYVQ